MRVLGVDVGEVRVGLALSDRDGVVATPFATLPAGDDLAERLIAVAGDQQCDTIVVGLPKGMSNRDTASTRMARALARQLEQLGADVRLWDERLSSAEAERVLLAAGRRREERREERDRVAAAIVLQGWLDAQRSNRTEGDR